jgi:outer membrane protein TolC
MSNSGFVSYVSTDSLSPRPHFRRRRSPGTWGIARHAVLLVIVVAAEFSLGQAPSSAPATATYSDAPSPMIPGATGRTSQNPFLGSVPSGKASTEALPISFADAIRRGLEQNLGLLLASDNAIAARGLRWKELSALLPNLNAIVNETSQQASLAALGLRIPGFPRVVGPFNYFDARASMEQSVFDLNYIERERAARENLKAAHYSYKDARELVVLAVGNAYLQALAGAARVETADAQVKTAQALYDKAVDQQKAGVTPAIDTLRAQVELQTRQQQLIVARNDFAKEKLALARIIGLPPGQEFTLTSEAPYEPLTTSTLDEALQRAYADRSDYQALKAQVRAAELFRRAAGAQYLPSFGLEADYGAIGVSPASSNGTYHVAGTIKIPIFRGGKTHADVLQAEATLRQQRQQLDNLRGQIDYEVRTALLDLKAAADQVEVARSSVDLATQTLTQAQDRFAAGVTDNLEVVQAQEALSSAHENYIASLYAHNLAKVEFAKAIGYAEEGVKSYLKGK